MTQHGLGAKMPFNVPSAVVTAQTIRANTYGLSSYVQSGLDADRISANTLLKITMLGPAWAGCMQACSMLSSVFEIMGLERAMAWLVL
jgi:hypothetical protein